MSDPGSGQDKTVLRSGSTPGAPTTPRPATGADAPATSGAAATTLRPAPGADAPPTPGATATTLRPATGADAPPTSGAATTLRAASGAGAPAAPRADATATTLRPASGPDAPAALRPDAPAAPRAGPNSGAATTLRPTTGSAGAPAAPRAGLGPGAPTPFDASAGSAAATTLRSAPPQQPQRKPATLTPGLRIESGVIVKQRYVLEDVIGSGAMGEVWRSKDLMRERARNARPHVAIKLLNADCAQHPDALVGLEREASKAQDLAHPNIITVHNFDVDDDLGRAFISMECLQGESLDEVIRKARGVGLSREAALPIIEGITEGLEYAHRKHVVHCDLKPGNVFVTSDGVPKILDFGIARAARREGMAGSAADEDGFKGFTPAYASVELISEQDPQTADDIYSLGIVVYELLTGRHPFNDLPADVAKARQMKPTAIKGLKASQWQAIERALAFDRAARWSNASEFRKAFKGRTLLPRVLGVAVGVLTLALIVFAYQRWRAEQPDVPLDQLPRDQQATFMREIQDGDRSWQLVSAGQTFLINDALAHYGAAFDIHPRDPQAVTGLKRTADYVIDRLEHSPDKQASLAQLQEMQKRSVYLESYGPLVRAIEHLGGSASPAK